MTDYVKINPYTKDNQYFSLITIPHRKNRAIKKDTYEHRVRKI